MATETTNNNYLYHHEGTTRTTQNDEYDAAAATDANGATLPSLSLSPKPSPPRRRALVSQPLAIALVVNYVGAGYLLLPYGTYIRILCLIFVPM